MLFNKQNRKFIDPRYFLKEEQSYKVLGSVTTMMGNNRVDIRVVNSSTSQIEAAGKGINKDINQAYTQAIQNIQVQLQQKNIQGVTLPRLEQLDGYNAPTSVPATPSTSSTSSQGIATPQSNTAGK